MSTPGSGSSRRRRIAGERRSGRGREEIETGGTEERGVDTLAQPDSDPMVEGQVDEPVLEAAPEVDEPVDEPAYEPVDEVAVDDEESSPTSAGGWWGSRASLLVLTAVLVVVLAVTTLLAFGLLGNRGVADVREADDAQSAGRSASATAERAAQAILAYDYRNLDAARSGAEAFMTDDFASQYGDTFDDVVAPAAKDTRARVTAEVQASGVIRATPDRVRVLLFVDQKTVSTAHEGPQVALNRVEFDMVRSGGSWQVDDISSY